MDIHYFIGIKIKARRKELGLSGASLAKILNISQQQISRYENGINKIPLNHLVSIAVALKCPIDWFFQGCISDEDYSIQDSNMGIKNQELKYTAESVIVHNKMQFNI
ncbi:MULTISPECIES: helix-turn-helix domain-containing protein [Morganellaceae]|uniref:Transcriptional repressor DicA n=1 Tax=Proteus penneri TaxID=102862 RepID=A0A0G4Q5C5_9GAMM|nr:MULTISPECIES: helix-turn-helix transcriptional regulator [Proteus]EJD6329423.1 helix-turn-helix transcriptional regulator [Proteus mirabilis]EJD6390385.1 helix-turn-helix transcriptional regulator [Proteus mirabilis]ELB1205639.1 helix-turn-helix transcriptional regulator [Proteus mirabilis]MCU9563847.1 helix-turn-helix transcriptional regulator [Proteus mirabilis]MDC9777095.1 helix-turn-helix transcriptional regulator [Proteus mirabilis]